MHLQPLPELLQIHGARLARDLAPTLEDGRRRNAADPVLLRQARIFVGVYLCESHARLQLGCDLLEKRSHHAAWTAPGSPEVHGQGQIRTFEMAVEAAIGENDRVAGKQRILTLPAAGLIPEPRGRDPIGGLATRTNDDLRPVHENKVSRETGPG